jgi:hypothetical protein
VVPVAVTFTRNKSRKGIAWPQCSRAVGDVVTLVVGCMQRNGGSTLLAAGAVRSRMAGSFVILSQKTAGT